jgi:hypothetical protein
LKRETDMGAEDRDADQEREPTREEVERMPGPVVLEFGAGW